MSIAKGSTDISKIYLGSTEVTKMYLGDTLVYGDSSETLPYDAEVEYLQSDGNQYIEIPVIPSESTDAIEIEFRRTSDTTQQRFFMATPNGTNTSKIFQCYVNGNSRIGWCRNGVSWTTLLNSNNTSIGLVKHTLKFDYYNGKATYDGQEYSIASSGAGEYNLILFGQYGSQAVFQGLVYSVKFWRSGVLMYNLQPVRKDGVGYFYDKVGGTLYSNSGTGAFTIGYDKLTSLSDFTQLEYIENTSSSATAPFIITGVRNYGTIDMTMTVKWNDISSSLVQYFGNSYGPSWGCDSGVYYGAGDMTGTAPSTTDFETVSMDTFTTTPSVYSYIALFRRFQGGDKKNTSATYNCYCKLSSYKIMVDSVLVRDFVPVLHPSGVYGMFDKVENKFYASATSVGFSGG